MNFISEVLIWLRSLTPPYWIRNHSTNKALDKWILAALKSPRFRKISERRVVLNGVELWVSNYPYAYGYMPDFEGFGMPSRRTTIKLKKAVEEHIIESGMDKINELSGK